MAEQPSGTGAEISQLTPEGLVEIYSGHGETLGSTSVVGYAGQPKVLGLMQDALEYNKMRMMAVLGPDGKEQGLDITPEDVQDPHRRTELLAEHPNQDHCVVGPDGSVAVLCDGAGGLGGGREVSRVASQACADSLADRWNVFDDPAASDQDLIHTVHAAMKDADRAILEAKGREHVPEHRDTWTGRLHREIKPMPNDAATTLTVVARPKGRPNTAVIGHAGDTAATLWGPNDGTLTRLTPNQSQGSRLKNWLDGNESRRTLADNVSDLEKDQVFVVEGIGDDDQIVLFSDGTDGDHPVQRLPDEEIVRVLSEATDPATKARMLATLPRDFKRQNPDYEITYTDKSGQQQTAPFQPKDDDAEVVVMSMRGTPINPDNFDVEQDRNNPPRDLDEAIQKLGLTAPERQQIKQLLETVRDKISSDSKIAGILEALNISDDNRELFDPKEKTESILKGVGDMYKGGKEPGQYIEQLRDPETGMDMGAIYATLTEGLTTRDIDGGYGDTSQLRRRLAGDGMLLRGSLEYLKQAGSGEVSKRLLQVRALLRYTVSKIKKDQFSRWVDRVEEDNWR